MILYHGSKVLLKKPLFKGSDVHNDYGPAFYLTDDLEAAKYWACKNNEAGIVNKYFINDNEYKSLNVLDLTDENKYSVLNWIAILIHHREFDTSFIKRNVEVIDYLSKYYIDINKFDVIIGFRADDAYFRFPKEFINGNLSYDDLTAIYKAGNLGKQIVFISNKAIKKLRFSSFIECDYKYVGKYYDIVKSATKELDSVLELPKTIKKTYIYNLMEKDNDIK